jgi:hypothetical protein
MGKTQGMPLAGEWFFCGQESVNGESDVFVINLLEFTPSHGRAGDAARNP